MHPLRLAEGQRRGRSTIGQDGTVERGGLHPAEGALALRTPRPLDGFRQLAESQLARFGTNLQLSPAEEVGDASDALLARELTILVSAISLSLQGVPVLRFGGSRSVQRTPFPEMLSFVIGGPRPPRYTACQLRNPRSVQLAAPPEVTQMRLPAPKLTPVTSGKVHHRL